MSSRIAVVLIVCGFVSIAAGDARGQQATPGPVDLLARVDSAQGGVAGQWSNLGEQLRVVAGSRARFELPYDVRGGYDLGVEFTRTRGEDSVGIILPVGTGQCIINFGAFAGEAHGIALINGKQARDNETAVRPGKLANNNRYRANVSVRLDGDNATISVDLDDKELMAWSGKQSALMLPGIWRIPSKKRVGLSAFNNTTVFHKVQLQPMVGRPGPPRPTQPEATADAKTIEFEGKEWVVGLADSVTVEQYKGKTALHVVGQEAAYVYLPGVQFQDGVIEVDIASSIFSGVGFRGRQDGSRVEIPYFRPQNSGTDKHDNSVQYTVHGRPDGAWQYLRTNFPGKYEAGADMKRNQWFHARFEIQGTELKIFVNADPRPVLVVEKMLDGVSQGTVGVWGWNSYFANFKYTANE